MIINERFADLGIQMYTRSSCAVGLVLELHSQFWINATVVVMDGVRLFGERAFGWMPQLCYDLSHFTWPPPDRMIFFNLREYNVAGSIETTSGRFLL